MLSHAKVHRDNCMTYVLVHHCSMCLYLSVGVRSSSVIPADDGTSLFLHDFTETATVPSTLIAEVFQQHTNSMRI